MYQGLGPQQQLIMEENQDAILIFFHDLPELLSQTLLLAAEVRLLIL